MNRTEPGKEHERLLKIAALFASTVLLIVPNLALVNAAPPTQISGIWGPNSDAKEKFFDFKYEGGNIFCQNNVGGAFLAGPIVGDFDQSLYIKLHYGDPRLVAQYQQDATGVDDPQMGALVATWDSPNTFEFTHMVREVRCTDFMGKTGTFEMLLVCQGTGMPVVKGPYAFDLQGTWVITHGTGDLANLHGHGTWWHTSDIALPFSYEGQVTFGP